MQIFKVSPDNLDQFLESELYLNSKVLIIPEQRAKSMAVNPSTNATDALFYVAHRENEIVGFIGFFPDQLQNGNQVFWNSGWWVADNEGFQTSMPLLKHFLEDTADRLFITDATEHSAKILQRIPGLTQHQSRVAHRFFLDPGKSNISQNAVLKWGVRIIGRLYKYLLKMISGTANSNSSLAFQEILPKALSEQWLKQYNEVYTIRLTKEKIQWIMNNPWVTTKTDNQKSTYPFTYQVKNYSCKLYLVLQNEKEIGWMMVNIINGICKVPYSHIPNEHAPGIAAELLKLAFRHQCNSIYILNPELNAAMEGILPGFVFKRKYNVPLLVSETLMTKEKIILQDGDGDAVFT